MISIALKDETPFLATFKNQQISIMKKKMVCYAKSIEKSELSDIGLVGTSRAENLNLTYYVDAKYDFNSLKGWNALFSDFQKSTDLDNEKKMVCVTKNL